MIDLIIKNTLTNKTMKKTLKIIANIYLSFFAVFWLYCMFNIFLSRGFTGIQETLSPFNFANLVVTIIALFPYFILVAVAGKIKPKEN